jgi:hypothetical protein
MGPLTVCMTCGDPVPAAEAACGGCGAWGREDVLGEAVGESPSERLLRSVEASIRSHASLRVGRARELRAETRVQRNRAVEARLRSQIDLLEMRLRSEGDQRDRAALELAQALALKELEGLH